MNAEFSRPRVLCSRCLTFEACRWNGGIINNDLIESMKKYIDFETICPEKDCGLGVPRPRIRLIEINKQERLMQTETRTDITDKMQGFITRASQSFQNLDGILLKARSPTCGIQNVDLYNDIDQRGTARRTAGIFGHFLLQNYVHVAITDEGHLENQRLREDFLIRIFTAVKFRKMRETARMRELVQFHSEIKLILMAYNQNLMRQLGNVVANREKKPPNVVIDSYSALLSQALAKPATYRSHLNVLMHALGYFKKQLSAEEKQYFLQNLDEYAKNIVPLSVCLSIIKAWIIRFNESYLAQQMYFRPFPAELMIRYNKKKEFDNE